MKKSAEDSVFVDGIQSMSTDQLKALIVIIQVQVQENEAFKEAEEYLMAEERFKLAKEQRDLVAKPVKENANLLKKRTKLVVERLKEKGGA